MVNMTHNYNHWWSFYCVFFCIIFIHNIFAKLIKIFYPAPFSDYQVGPLNEKILISFASIPLLFLTPLFLRWLVHNPIFRFLLVWQIYSFSLENKGSRVLLRCFLHLTFL